MSLADRIEDDIRRVFYRESEFATKHRWNDREILCQIDSLEELRHKNANVLAVDYDTQNIDTVVRIPASELPRKPEPQETVWFDGRMKYVENCIDACGEYIVTLKDNEARDVL